MRAPVGASPVLWLVLMHAGVSCGMRDAWRASTVDEAPGPSVFAGSCPGSRVVGDQETCVGT
ncbi:uncharacterized protein SAZU_0190 [Streptomyces azureus]|uniref:Uncharacterized protein n=1 Tax=Streptomyces azureus TaxID=146537 RepID=A0A0K8PC68_STRAJ|nr:uncharacterized protein SAZU_0190 [Streptomyces azureus]